MLGVSVRTKTSLSLEQIKYRTTLQFPQIFADTLCEESQASGPEHTKKKNDSLIPTPNGSEAPSGGRRRAGRSASRSRPPALALGGYDSDGAGLFVTEVKISVTPITVDTTEDKLLGRAYLQT